MGLQVSRRSLLGAAGAGAALAASGSHAVAQAMAPAGSPLAAFGPPRDEAHLLFNENPYGPAPSAVRAMAEVASKGCYYIDDVQPELTARIAARFGVKPEQVVLGNGSFEVLSAAALVWGAKGPIVTPELFFEEPLHGALRMGATVVRAPLGADMGVDLGALAAAVKPGTAMVYICNPNNPTGMLIDPAALRSFIRSLPTSVTVLVDEAYMELTDRPEANSMIDLVREGRNVIISRTFSKIYGMAGLRVGYLIASAENAKRADDRLLTISLSAPALAAALGSFDDSAFLRFSLGKVQEGRAMLTDAVQKAGLRALPSQTNFLFVEVPDANRVRDAMAARNIRIRGAYGRWTRWSRVSCGLIEHVQRYAEALPVAVRA